MQATEPVPAAARRTAAQTLAAPTGRMQAGSGTEGDAPSSRRANLQDLYTRLHAGHEALVEISVKKGSASSPFAFGICRPITPKAQAAKAGPSPNPALPSLCRVYQRHRTFEQIN